MKFSYYLRLIEEDYLNRYSSKMTFSKLLISYITDINFRVTVRFRIQSYFNSKSKKLKIFAVFIRNGNIKKYGVEIGINTKIDGGVNLHHVNGIVIGDGVVIGRRANIFQQVTIGKKNNAYPYIGNDVTIYPGSKIIGDINIGNNVTVGANSVVNKSVVDNMVVVGIPASEINNKRQVVRI
ncbi:serine O-acetyltransferase [Priestia sp. RMT2NF4]|uniref:serine O-acetyltransferase n=1 Tax=Priestia sp. RMT2NF4 TaxID=3398394 RepID=UPI003A4C6F98